MEKGTEAESTVSAKAGETGLEDFDDEEQSMLDLISSFGQEGAGQTSNAPDTSQKGGKKGK